MTPAPNHRWRRVGKPWGFFEKVNQDATAWTMALHAILGATIGGVAYGTLTYWCGWPVTLWPIKLVAFCGGFAVLYGLFHWQGGSGPILPPDDE